MISSLFAFQIRRQGTSSMEGGLHWERLRGIISTKATYAPMIHGEGTEAGEEENRKFQKLNFVPYS